MSCFSVFWLLAQCLQKIFSGNFCLHIFSTLIVFCGNQSERGIQLKVPHTISGCSLVPGCGRGKNYYFIYRIRQKVIYIINLFEHFLYSQSTYKLVRVAAALVSDRKIELSIDFPSSIPERQMRLIFPRWMDIYYFMLASEQIVIEINSVSGEIFALSSPVHTAHNHNYHYYFCSLGDGY